MGVTSVTRTWPPRTQAEADPASTWTVAKEWDWAAESSHTFSDNTAQSFQSVAFTPRNVGDSSSFAVDDSGLKIAATGSQAGGQWYSTIQTGPALMAPISSIVDGYSLKDTICVQALVDTTVVSTGGTLSQQYPDVALLLGDGGYGASGGGNWVKISAYRQLSTSDHIVYARYGGGAATGAGNNTASFTIAGGFPTFLELVFYPGTGWSSAASRDSDFQDPLSVTSGRYYANMQTSLPKDVGGGSNTAPGANPDFTLRPANLHLGLSFTLTQTGSDASSNANAVFTKLRVLKRNY
jgi:hypothetical protein